MSQEVLEGNRLIAIFDGMIIKYGDPNHKCDRCWFLLPDESCTCALKYDRYYKEDKKYFDEDLKYHTSWDWQIPVWSKLVPLIKELASNDPQHFDKYQRFLNAYENAVACNNPQTGQEIIIAALTWYNSRPPTKEK